MTPTLAQQSEALRVITDPTRDDGRLLDLCGGDTDVMGFVLAVTAIATGTPVALRRFGL